MSSRYDSIVIGGGHNGLTTATLLARAGQKVVIVERREKVGGLASSEEFHPGYRNAGVLHDTSTVRRWAADELELRKHGLEWHRESNPVFVPQKGGPGYLHWPDTRKGRAEIERLSKDDADRYGMYRSFVKRITPIFRRVFDDAPPQTDELALSDLWNLGKKAISLRLLGRDDMMELFRIAPMCVADWVGEWFDTEIVQAALAGQAVVHGITGPWSPGTNLNLLLAETQSQPGVVGGPAALTTALESAARAAGVEIMPGVRVARLSFQGQTVTGLSLSNGEILDAPKVAASCNPKHLFLDLVPPQLLSLDFERNASTYRCRGTAAKVDLALSRYPEIGGRPELEPLLIRTGASVDDIERSFDAIKYRDFSLEPMLEIYVPTLDRRDLAPEGHHVFSILVHWVPYELEGGWDDDSKDRLLESVLDTLTAYMPGIRSDLVAARLLTPVDLEKQYGVTGGNLLHGEHAIDQLVTRPFPECNRYATPFPGLFLCGSGSHPGGGLTCAPGVLAARAMLS